MICLTSWLNWLVKDGHMAVKNKKTGSKAGVKKGRKSLLAEITAVVAGWIFYTGGGLK